MGSPSRTKKVLLGAAFLALAALALTFIILYFTKSKSDNVSPDTPTTPAPVEPQPLPEQILLDIRVRPSHYKLQVTPYFDSNQFKGSVVIDLDVLYSVNEIRMHSVNLTLSELKLQDANSNDIPLLEPVYEEKFQTVILGIKSGMLTKGKYQLSTEFGNNFKPGQFTGFYKTSYKTNGGNVRELVTTKFEPTYARLAFPCFDESTMKATFDISIIHPDTLTALSNERQISSVAAPQNGWKVTTFARTPLMSTYLVAYVVSDFTYTESKTKRGIPVRVFARPDQSEKTQYAAEVAADILDFYEDYTGIPYALSKMDLIGIPGFVTGAMENWGLVTYKENYVLYDSTISSVFNQRQVASVIAHELAHMWWGNLVTLNWWGELYLNEGHATYIQVKGQNHVNSSWSNFDNFVITDFHGALRADMLKSAHPLNNNDNVLTPDQATAQFDTISYSKGAAILGMLESFIGKDDFQAAQKEYLKDFSYSSATSFKFFQFFDKYIGAKTDNKMSANDFMEQWINGSGFPILNPTRSGSKNGETTITVKQTPYHSDSANLWNVPIKWATPNKKGEFVLTKTSDSFTVELSDDEWFKLNQDSQGYYIVNYTAQDWALLTNQLQQNPKVFSVKDRANLLFDAYQLTGSKTSAMNYAGLFKLIEYLKNEDEYLPWAAASSVLSGIRNRLSAIGSLSSVQFDSYVRELIRYVYDKTVDFNADSTERSFAALQIESVMIDLACKVQHKACLDETQRLFEQFINTRTPINPLVRGYVYKYGIQSSNSNKDFEVFWNAYRAELDATEKARLITALTSTPNSGLLNQLVKYSEDQELVDNENFFSFQQNIAANPTGRGLVWEYIRKNWNELVQRFGLNDRRLGNYVRSVCQSFATETRLNEMKTFFAENPNAGAGAAARKSAIESVEKNIAWAKENEVKISYELSKRDELAMPWLQWRLNEFVLPSAYEIALTIDIDNQSFNGTVKIDYEVKSPTNHLILHSKDLTILSSKVVSSTNVVVSKDDDAMNFPQNQFFVIPMKKILTVGQYRAELAFTGKLMPDLSGLYLSSYVRTSDNKRVYLATTQFESGYARKAFPCFDEPNFKARFTISITADSKYTSVSNMPVTKNQDVGKGWRKTDFQQSVPMSTYLVAFVVSDFKHVKSENDPRFGVLTFDPAVNEARCKLANEIGPKIVKYYEEYFGSLYQLPKLDHVAVPDFSLGAMENWGLITYRDTLLLYDEKETTLASKISISYVIAHELAHMWFGNQVTIKWWDELWLNEGFATFMEYKAVQAVMPELNFIEEMPIGELSRVFDIDSSASSRSILTVVRDMNDMQMIFDGITYAKGASVIRMLEATIGAENFQKAMISYMKKYAYNNTVTTDLWSEFSNAIDEKLDVTHMMNNWVVKEGFPVVTIGDTNNGTIQLSQIRFLKDGQKPQSSPVWFIPLTYSILHPDLQMVQSRRVNFDAKSTQIDLENFNVNAMYKFNVNHTGLYLVNYPLETWKRFANELSNSDSFIWKQLTNLDRNSLLNDAYYLAQANMLPYEVAMNLSALLKYEENYVVWVTGTSMISYLQEFAFQQDGGIAFNEWVLTLVEPLYNKLGWEKISNDESSNFQRLRPLILSAACSANHQDCRREAKSRFKEFLEKAPKNRADYNPDPNVLTVILNQGVSAIQEGDDASGFEKLLDRYTQSKDTAERLRYLRALSSVGVFSKIDKLLEESMKPEFIRRQDFFTFLSYMASNPAAIERAWKFYQDNYEIIQENFGIEDPNLGRAVYRFGAHFSTQNKLEEIRALFNKYPKAGAGELYRKQAIELVQANIKWASQFYTNVNMFVTEKCDVKKCPWKQFRLNSDVVPLNYDLIMQVDNDKHIFNGTVTIGINVKSSQEFIVLHAAPTLTTRNAKITKIAYSTTNLLKNSDFRYSPFSFLVLPLKTPISGQYVIQIDFEGDNRATGMSGIYNGYYDNADGVQVNISSTQFQATSARKAFPCFDEPTFKQPMKLTIIHQESMPTTITNMPLDKKTSIRSGWIQSKFKETNVPLPTYLAAILVSDFDCESKFALGIGLDQNLTIQTCASSANSKKSFDYSLQVTPLVLESFEKTLGQKYQLPKLDQVALPQFAAGAMENWGLVKYRENLLLWNEDDNTVSSERSVSSVIAHELAHMWFGNSLTCEYWGELWLNEAFASYMEYSAVSDAHPDWNYFDFLMTDDRINAFRADFASTAHPLIRNVNKPEELSYVSAIIYAKGATTLHMFNRTMGAGNFGNALKDYQKNFENKNVNHQNLYDSFKTYWPYPKDGVKHDEFFDSWTKQAGFPYVNITCQGSANCQYTQARFVQGFKSSTKYVLPYSYYDTNFKQAPIQLLSEQTGKLPHKLEEIVKINPNFQGYFLVNYPKEKWDKLAEGMVANTIVSKLDANDRSELLYSAYQLARNKLADPLTHMKFFNYLKNEKNYIPFHVYNLIKNSDNYRLEYTDYRQSALAFERRIANAHYKKEMWNMKKKSNIEISFNRLIIDLACRSAHTDCLKNLLDNFDAFRQNPSETAPDLREILAHYGMRHKGDLAAVQDFVELFAKTPKTDSWRDLYRNAPASVSNWSVAQSYLTIVSNNQTVFTADDYLQVLKEMLKNFFIMKEARQFVTNNQAMLRRKLSTSKIQDLYETLASRIFTMDQRNELSKELNNLQINTGKILLIADSNIKWMQNDAKIIGEWYNENGCGTDTPQRCPWTNIRLDKNEISPQQYFLDLRVNVTSTIYDGQVSIQLKTLKSLSYLPVHAANQMNVELLNVTDSVSKKKIDGIQTFRYEPEMFVVLSFSSPLPAGTYVLNFSFNSSLLNNGLSGLYRSVYHDNGNDVSIASTQMEFTDARKMFPCFDDPTFKSNFTMSITHETHMNATFSNAKKIESMDLPGGWVKTTYETTPKMTTYLVAVLVSDYVCDSTTIENIVYRVCAPRIHQHKLEYALEKSHVALTTLEEKLGVKYPLPKVDLVAIPDFYYGAMENWGLITFRESLLLFHENDTTSETKIRIASVIAHEIAHFWFGNLVTCEWWDTLFLNEAFATLMQYPALSRMEGEWKIYEKFLMYDFDRAIAADSVETTHALVRPIKATRDIDQFDSAIIYAKGASVFRMVEFLMGRDKFFEGLGDYMNEMKFQNALPKDLLSAFDRHYSKPWSQISMTDFLDEWINKNGFPYLNVSRTGNSFTISQERFLRKPTDQSDLNTVWKVPISYYTGDDAKQANVKIITAREQTIELKDISTKVLPKLNVDHTGFYLVNYSPDLWKDFTDKLINQYDDIKIHESDRAGLLFDAFTLASGNKIKYSTPLALSQYLKSENESTPFTLAIRALDGIRKNVDLGSNYGKQFKEFVVKQFKPIYDDLGWDDSNNHDEMKRSLRSRILDFVCDYGLEDCLNEAAKKFTEWKSGKTFSPNILPVVLKYGIRKDISGQEWQHVWSLYQNEQAATMRSIYMSGLVGSPNQQMIQTLLNAAVNAQGIRSQDTLSTMLSVARSYNPETLETVWTFVQKNFDRFFSSESALKPNDVTRLLTQLANNYFFTIDSKSKFASFLSTKQHLLPTSAIQASLNAIDGNIQWLQSRMSEIENFLLCGEATCPFTLFRLPQTIQPESYKLFINVDLENDKFSGNVTISLDTTKAIEVRYIHLHASESLNIVSTKVVTQSGILSIGSPIRYSPFEFFVIPLKNPLQEPKVTLIFEFNGEIADDNMGLYKSVYLNPNSGENVKLASTQFQDIFARRVFPCFDEPAFKATFDVTIQHNPQLNVRSNMAVKSSENGITTFERTPKMVSYLLAWVVSGFHCESTPAEGGAVNVSVCAIPPEKDSIQYSLGIVPKLIDEFNTKFDYKYSVNNKKMDLYAIPDFAAGAMENWGILTFRETRLLWNEKNTDASIKMSVANVVAHEITHMWFGNLVTCQFWSDLWINEAFAAYMEYFSVDAIEPEWDYKQLMFVTDYMNGMQTDAISTSHPLVRNVQKPSDISYLTGIIYDKGASILRMFEHTFSTEKFFTKLQEYLKENQYESVPSDVLLGKLGQIVVPELKTEEFLISWTKQAGFPFLNLTRKENGYNVVQKRFFSNGDTDTSGQFWIVPLTYYKSYSQSVSQPESFITEFLNETETNIVLREDTNLLQPIKFNVDSQGFYIVNYPENEWKEWIETLKKPGLHLTSQDMAHLLFSASLLAKAGYVNYEIPLGLTQALKHKEDFSVWRTSSSVLAGLWPYFRANSQPDDLSTVYEKSFTDFAQSLVAEIYDSYGLQSQEKPGNHLQEQRLRQTVSSFACLYRLPRCLLEAQIEFGKWRQNPDYFLSPNVRSTVLRYGIQASRDPQADWNHLWQLYIKEFRTATKLDYLEALAASQDVDTVRLLLQRALDPALVRRQDYLSVWAYVTRTPVGTEVAWKFFKQNIDIIRKTRLTAKQIGSVASYFATYITTNEQRTEFEKFFADNPQSSILPTSLESAKQKMRANSAWIDRFRPEVVRWLKNDFESRSL